MSVSSCSIASSTAAIVTTTSARVRFGELLALVDASGRVESGAELSAPHRDGCVLTFDDATSDHLGAAEQLAGAGMRGVFYVPTGSVGERGHLTAGEIVALAQMGHVVGSHCVTHETADRLSEPALAAELETSKRYLEDLLGSAVTALALPGGITTGAAPSLARAAGYSSLRLTRWGIYGSEQQRWRIPCVPITRFTIRRGWVGKAARDLRLPPDMEIVGRAKDLLPRSVASKARAMLHRSAGSRA